MTIKTAIIHSAMLCILSACNLVTQDQIAISTDLSTISPTSLPFPTSLPPETSDTQAASLPAMPQLSVNQVVLNRSAEVIQVLKSGDFSLLSSYVHPGNGVRFSPYAYITDSDQVFSADEIFNILADSKAYTWGAYAGSGEPINLSFPEYYAKFIYDQDFANAPKMALNYRLGGGNSIDNSSEFFPGAMIVEYYFPGFDPQYEGMDWRSLRLVFSAYDGIWYLVGIVHDEWTP